MNIQHLRDRIRKRSEALGIRPAHDERGHWYEFEGQKYTSVTTRLQVLKDPGLMNWKMNRALEYIEEQYNLGIILNIEECIEQAKLVPQLEFEGAGDIGTQVHNWREEFFNHLITQKEDEVIASRINLEGPLAVVSGCRAINKFLSETGYIPLACELYLADHKLRIGGQLDDMGLINGELCLIDLKTSNQGNKDAYYAQICLYLHIFRKLYRLYPKKVYILHVSKENGTYELIPLHERVDINKTIRWAKKVVEVAAGLDELRETKKKKAVIL